MTSGQPETGQSPGAVEGGEITSLSEAIAAIQVERAAREALQEDLRKAREISEELKEEFEKQRKEREELNKQLEGMAESQKAGFFGLGTLHHPSVRRDEDGSVVEGKEPYEDLKEQYAAIINRETDKMERRSLPYDNFRVLWLMDYVEAITSDKRVIEELGPEQAGRLSSEVLEYLEMREAIWNRIYWHEKSQGFLKVICADDSPQLAAEQMAMFENDPYRPEIKAAVEAFLDPKISSWFIFGEKFSNPSLRGKVCSPYIYALLRAGSKKRMCQEIERMIIEKTRQATEEIEEGQVTKKGVELTPVQARVARNKVESYLKALGWVSILDPGMMLDTNDEIKDAAFGGTRNRERMFGLKPAGPIFGNTLFVDRLTYTTEKGQTKALGLFKKVAEGGNVWPLVLLDAKNAGEPQYVGSFYHQTTVEGRISDDGKNLIIFQPSAMTVRRRGELETRVALEGELEELMIPLEGVGIRGKPLVTREDGCAEGKIRGKMVRLRLIDLMTDLRTGEIKPLPEGVWPFLSSNAFGGMLLGWFSGGMRGETNGFYGLTLKNKWEPYEVNYYGVVALHHKVRQLMRASPLLNVLTSERDAKKEKGEWMVVKMNRRGEVCFGSELEEREKKHPPLYPGTPLNERFFGSDEIHELLTARLAVMALSTLTLADETSEGGIERLLKGRKAEGSFTAKTAQAKLRAGDVDYVTKETLSPPRNAPEVFKTGVAKKEFKDLAERIK